MNIHSEKKASRPRGRPLVDDKKKRIIDAALQVFAKRGYHGTAVPLVAEAAGVGTGTIYRYFADKETLVNEVFRTAKRRLQHALYDRVLPKVESDAAVLFAEMWAALVDFAQGDPVAFQFVEMQDHAPYLDAESQSLERGILEPIYLAVTHFREGGILRGDMTPEAQIAFVWGALVGLFKAERLGMMELDDATLAGAGKACWAALAAPAAAENPRKGR